MNVKKIHLIAPSVWAYRASRAKKIAKIYNLLLAILPFEPPYFEVHGLKTKFIGYPIIENAPNLLLKTEKRQEFCQKHNINPQNKIIAVTPGSRISEVKRIFPQFIVALNLLYDENCQNNDLPNFVVTIMYLPKTKEIISNLAQKLKMPYFLINGEAEKENLLFAANYALAKSGTNSIEFALYEIPMIIAYKINFLTYLMLKPFIKINFANIINLIANKEIIPEAIQQKCNSQFLKEKLKIIMTNENYCINQINNCKNILQILRPSPKKIIDNCTQENNLKQHNFSGNFSTKLAVNEIFSL